MSWAGLLVCNWIFCPGRGHSSLICFQELSGITCPSRSTCAYIHVLNAFHSYFFPATCRSFYVLRFFWVGLVGTAPAVVRFWPALAPSLIPPRIKHVGTGPLDKGLTRAHALTSRDLVAAWAII